MDNEVIEKNQLSGEGTEIKQIGENKNINKNFDEWDKEIPSINICLISIISFFKIIL